MRNHGARKNVGQKTRGRDKRIFLFFFFFKEFSADFLDSPVSSHSTLVSHILLLDIIGFITSHGGEHRSLIKTKESDEMTYNCERCCGGRAER